MRFRRARRAVSVLLAAALAGCASVNFEQAPAGRFSGDLFVMWVGEGDSSGDGRFLFVPDPHAPLTFSRSDANGAGAVIKPGLMYTDGGSIPKIAQIFRGLSPWGYAPAYMVHDWLYVARHCLVDGDPDPRFTPVANVDFDESAKILAEAIKALMASRQVQSNDIAGDAITAGVDSFVARQLWDTKGACAESHVSARDLAAAEAAIPGSTRRLAITRGPVPAGPAVRARPARIVAKLSFGR